MYERLLTWMLNPALAIFSMVASCKLPLGSPKRSFFFTSAIPKTPSPEHFHFLLSDLSDCSWIKLPFCILNSSVQNLRRVVIKHRDSLLRDDGACIHPLIDKMHRATRHLRSI